ncbi:MAG: hypothetical protein WBP81_38220 [Solirubrobacteraceae bacterium]
MITTCTCWGAERLVPQAAECVDHDLLCLAVATDGRLDPLGGGVGRDLGELGQPGAFRRRAALLALPLRRAPTEVAYEEGKEQFGVGEARNRSPKAVQRTVPFQFLAMTLTITWYALHGHHPNDVTDHRQRSPWYLTGT